MIHLPVPPAHHELSADANLAAAWSNPMRSPERDATLAVAAAKLGADPAAADAWATWQSSALSLRPESDQLSGHRRSDALSRSYSQSPLLTGATLRVRQGCRSPGT